MTWKINFTTSAEKEFSKLQKNLKVSIKNYLQDKVQKEPRDFGKPLVSSGSIKLWRYRLFEYIFRIVFKCVRKTVVFLVRKLINQIQFNEKTLFLSLLP